MAVVALALEAALFVVLVLAVLAVLEALGGPDAFDKSGSSGGAVKEDCAVAEQTSTGHIFLTCESGVISHADSSA